MKEQIQKCYKQHNISGGASKWQLAYCYGISVDYPDRDEGGQHNQLTGTGKGAHF